MTRREIAALCCRILALIIVVWGAMYFAQMLVALNLAIASSTASRFPESTFGGVKWYGSLSCAMLLCAMALGWKAETISRWMASDDPTPVTGPDLSADALMPVACAGVGLYAITKALPIFFRLASILASGQSTLGEIWDDNDWKINLGTDALMLAWGVWLVLGSRGVIRIMTWARAAGKEQSPSNGDNPSPQGNLHAPEK